MRKGKRGTPLALACGLAIIAHAGAVAQGVAWEAANGNTWAPVRALLTLSSEEYLFSAGASGIFYSPDHGQTITLRNNGLENATSLCLALDGAGTVYAGAVEGVFRSGDWGQQWTGTGLQGIRVNALVCVDDEIVLAGTNSSKVYRSTDGGATWSASGEGMSATVVQALALDASGRVYAGTRGGGVFVSTDSGATWSASNAGLGDLVVYSLFTRAPGIILAGTRTGGLFCSTDYGVTWLSADVGTPVNYVYGIAGGSSGVIAAASYAGGVFLSTDNGIAWTPTAASPPEIYSLALADDHTLIAGTNSGGVFRSTNSGSTWFRINVQLSSSVIRALCLVADGTMLAASETDGLCRTLDGGDTWGLLAAERRDISALAATSSDVILAGLQSGEILRSTNGGVGWTLADSGTNSPSVLSIVRDPAGRLYASSLGGGIRRTTDNGATWHSADSGLGSSLVRSLNVADNGDLLAGTDRGGIFLSTDGATTWSGMGLLHAVVFGVIPDGAGGFLAATDLGMYRSGTGETPWVHELNTLAGLPVCRLVRLDNWTLIAGTYGWGTFLSRDNGASWVSEHSGLANSDIYDIAVGPDGRLMAATGGGVFRSAGPPVSGVAPRGDVLPLQVRCEPGYPNPFNGETVIPFALPREAEVAIRILDIRGRLVERIEQGRRPAGRHFFRWHPAGVSSGAYICVVEAGGSTAFTKVIYVR